MALIRMLSFNYTKNNKVEQLILPEVGGRFPVKPILTAMGLNPARVYSSIREFPHEMEVIVGYSSLPAMVMKPAAIRDWFKTLTRYRNKELLNHFETLLIRSMNEFLEDREFDRRVETAETDDAHAESEDEYIHTSVPPSAYQPEYKTEYQARQYLGQHDTIYLNTTVPLSGSDKMRLFLNRRGITDWDVINYMVKMQEKLTLCKIDPQSKHGFQTRTYTVHVDTDVLMDLCLIEGWDVPTIFFLKYPHLYTQETKEIVGLKQGNTRVRLQKVPKFYAPWHEDTFADRVRSMKRIRDKVNADEFASRVKSGDISWETIINDMNNFATSYDNEGAEIEIDYSGVHG